MAIRFFEYILYYLKLLIFQRVISRWMLLYFTAPSSPVHNRRLLSAKPVRMSSVELPDENEKSPSSASNSPIPSPIVRIFFYFNLITIQKIKK